MESRQHAPVNIYDNLSIRKQLGFDFPAVDIGIARRVEKIFQILKIVLTKGVLTAKSFKVRGKVILEGALASWILVARRSLKSEARAFIFSTEP